MKFNLYDILGVNEKASQDTIKKVYRKQALKNHPDKGGNQEIFNKISHAYNIISDPQKREYYDNHGEDPTDGKNKVIDAVINLFFGVIEELSKNDNYLYTNLINKMIECIDRESLKRVENITKIKDRITVIKNIKSRLKCKNKKPGILVLTLENQIEQLDDSIKKINNTIELGDDMKKFIKDYSYKVDIRKNVGLGNIFTVENINSMFDTTCAGG